MSRTATSILILSLLLTPAQVSGSSSGRTSQTAPVVRDVLIDGSGTARLQILDAAGTARHGIKVEVAFGEHTIAQARSGNDGRVVIHKVRPGTHRMKTLGTTTVVRFWTIDSAPPNAIKHPVFVVQEETVRGQLGGPGIAPAVLALGVASTAIAVVLIEKDKPSNRQPVASAAALGTTSSLDSSSGSGSGSTPSSP